MNEIVVHGGDYDHVRGLEGACDGVRIAYRSLPVRRIFAGMQNERRYEACEFSAANYLLLRGTGNDWLSAIPVFPYRAFRHSILLVRKASPLTSLTELAGKRIGVDDYSMTAAVWLRGLLRSEYGIDHRSIVWVTPRVQRFPLPAGANIEQVDTDEPEGSLEARLLRGSIDAALGFSFADSQRPAHERSLRTLLPDPETAEREYYGRTGIYPIHHCVVVRNDVLARRPRLPQALLAAYEAAKARAIARRSASLLPWPARNSEREARNSEREARVWDRDMSLFGGDPLAYGWTDANRRNVATLAGYLREQGFIPTKLDVDRLFLTGA